MSALPRTHAHRHSAERSTTEPAWARRLLIGVAVGGAGLLLIAPLSLVFVSALASGVRAYFSALAEPAAQSALWLTLLAAGIAVPLNLIFGLAAAWLLSKYGFPGRRLLITLVDLPFSVSPVIAGLIFVLLFGARSPLGSWLAAHDIKVIFAVPGIVLATTFITLPMIARELLAVMQTQSSQEEEAALTLGASGWQIFWRVTLPKVRWGLLYGVILCNARAMGEFGAVSVVSGHVRGETNTLPLHIEVLYNEYQFAAAFAVASLLAMLALVTMGLKKLIEVRSSSRRSTAQSPVPVPAITVSAAP